MNDIAFKVIIKNDGIDDVIFKTLMLKGEKGDRGEAGGAQIDDSTISSSTTWSSSKSNTELNKKANTNSLKQVAFSGNYNDLTNKPEIQIFNRNDVLLNVAGGTLRGFGSAVVFMYKGIARIDFNIKISVDETVSGIGSWGINRDYFTALTGKTIQPLPSGIVTYYNNEQIYASRMDFGGTFLVDGQFWKPARVYDDNGTKKVGGWTSGNFASGQRLIGTCYGTYT